MIAPHNNENPNKSSGTISLSGHTHLAERPTSESLVALIPDAESPCDHSNNGRRGSTVPESPRLETPPDPVDDVTGLVNQHATNSVNILDNEDLDIIPPEAETLGFNEVNLALQDEDLDPIVHRRSLIDESVARTNFAPTESQRTDNSGPSRLTRKRRLMRSQPGHSDSTVTVSEALSSTSTRRHVQYRCPTSPESSESDNPEDDDSYNDSHGEDNLTDMEVQVLPAKRQKRASVSTSSPHQRRRLRERVDPMTTSLSSRSGTQSMVQTSTDLETIRIHGQLVRKVSLSRIEYCCLFTEDRGSADSGPHLLNSLASIIGQNGDRDQLAGLSDFHTINIEGLFTRELKPSGCTWSCSFREKNDPSPPADKSVHVEQLAQGKSGLTETKRVSRTVKKPRAAKGTMYSPEEDKLIRELKEIENRSWSDIATYFPGRTANALQVRYCTELKTQHGTRGKDSRHSRMGQTRSIATSKPRLARSRQPTENTAPSRQYGLRKNRRSPDRYSPE